MARWNPINRDMFNKGLLSKIWARWFLDVNDSLDDLENGQDMGLYTPSHRDYGKEIDDLRKLIFSQPKDFNKSPVFYELGVGLAPEKFTAGSVAQTVRTAVAGGNSGNITTLDTFNTINQECSRIQFRKSATDDKGAKVAVGTGDWIGILEFEGVSNAGDYAYGAYIKCVQNTLNIGDYVSCALEMGASDKDGNITGEIYIDGNTGYVGIGNDYTPCSTVEIADYLNVVTLTATDRTSDAEGAHGSSIAWRGFKAGGGIYDSHTVGKLTFSHEGTSADEKGKVIIEINSGTEGYNPRRAMKISSAGVIDYISGINNMVCHNDDVVSHNDQVVFSHPTWVYGIDI